MNQVWTADELDRIAGSEELEISSSAGRGSGRRWMPIWVRHDTQRGGDHAAPNSRRHRLTLSRSRIRLLS